MKLFIILLLCGAIVNAASNFIFTDDSWSGIVTGVPFQLTWIGNSGPVTITLNNGTTADPHLVNTIATNINSNSFTWTPGSFAVPGKKFFLAITDSTGAIAFGDTFVVDATASSTASSTSATSTSLTANPAPTASKTSTTASFSSPSSTSSPTSSKVQNGMERKTKIAIAIGIGLGIPYIVGVAWFVSFLCLKRAREKGEGAAQLTGDSGQSGVMDGAGDAKLTEKRHNEVAQVHELRADGTPEVLEMDGLARHELQ